MRWPAVFILACFFCCSCGEKLFTADVNCSDCYIPEPDSFYLQINLTINDEFKAVPLVTYRGDVEGNLVEYVDTAYESPFYRYVAVGTKYSVRAKYMRQDKTLYAVDGTKMRSLLVSGTCDEDCYVIRNDKVNLEIRKKFLDF